MGYRQSVALLHAVLLSPLFAHADPSELLIPVTGKEEQRASEVNSYFLKKDGYFASRYRIVRVNTDLLLGPEEELTISLFDGVKVPVVRKELDVRNEGINFAWHGSYATVSVTAEQIAQANPGMSLDMARQLYSTVYEFQIGGTQFVYDQNPAEAEELAGMRQDRSTGRLVHQKERLAAKLLDGTTIYSVSFNIRPILPSKSSSRNQEHLSPTYQLRPLPMDRRYSVLYEMDADKIIEFSDDMDSLSPDEAENVREYRSLLQSLGDDPRKTKISMESRQ